MAEKTTRFEIKYRLNKAHAEAVAKWIANFMEPDAFGEGGSASYSVHSLYLDDEDWSVYRDTRNGMFRRFKIRARTYGFTPKHNVFLEIKSRAGEAMWKSRVEVTRAEAIRLLRGEVVPNLRSSPQLEEFLAQRDLRNAVPKAWVTYRRDAWVGKDRETLVRVTFDSEIAAAPPTADLTEPPVWTLLPEVKDVVILELKYTHSYPPWIADLVRHFDIERRAMSKYRHAVDLLTEPRHRAKNTVYGGEL